MSKSKRALIQITLSLLLAVVAGVLIFKWTSGGAEQPDRGQHRSRGRGQGGRQARVQADRRDARTARFHRRFPPLGRIFQHFPGPGPGTQPVRGRERSRDRPEAG